MNKFCLKLKTCVVISSLIFGLTRSADTGPAASGYRPINGVRNNLGNQNLGAFLAPFQPAVVSSAYGDGRNSPSGPNRPNPKLVSTQLFGSASSVAQKELSDFTAYWGQFVAHDVSLIEGSPIPTEVIQVSIDNCELQIGSRTPCTMGSSYTSFNFSRADFDQNGPGNSRQPINHQTAFLDASTVYGANPNRTNLLRQFTGGLLKVSVNPRSGCNTLPMVDVNTAPLMAGSGPNLFFAGDKRANVNPPLQAIHTLFVLEHNRRARELAAKNPTWDDETLFQRARAWTIALIQKITYTQYLPAITGRVLPDYTGYDPTINVNLDTFFTAAAYRYGHSVVSPLVLRADSSLKTPLFGGGNILLRDHFFRTTSILGDDGDISYILRGLVLQADQLADTVMVDEIRKYFSDAPYDLAVMDILRGRDFGLADYNTYRQAYGFPAINTFQDLTNDTRVQSIMQSLYPNINDIDVWVGGLAEPIYLPGHVGALFTTAILNQFKRLRDGDRFWYQRDGVLQPGELDELSTWSLGKVITSNTRINSSVEAYPDNPFLAYSLTLVSSAPAAPSASTGSLQLTPVFRVSWQSDSASNNIQFTMCGNFSGWMAIGFNSLSSMTNADMIIATSPTTPAVWQINDYYSTGNVAPQTDTSLSGGVQNSQLVPGQIDSCFASTQGVTFKRKLNPGNSAYNYDLTKGGVLLYAYSDANTLDKIAYHGANRGSTVVSSFVGSASGLSLSGTGSNLINVKIFHGALMFLSIGIGFPMGIFCIRYLVAYSPSAIGVHRLVMSAFTICGWMSGILMLVTGVDPGFVHLHSIIAILVLILWFLNMTMGNIMLKRIQVMARYQRYIRKFHSINGYFSLLLGWVNGALGVIDVSVGTGSSLPVAIYLAWLVLTLAAFFGLGKFGLGFLNRIGLFDLLKGGAGFRAGSLRRSLNGSSGGSNGDLTGGDGSLSFSWPEFNNRVIEHGQSWLVISGNIYNVSDFVDFHPGGRQLIIDAIGTNATRAFYGTISKTLDFNEDGNTTTSTPAVPLINSLASGIKKRSRELGIGNIKSSNKELKEIGSQANTGGGKVAMLMQGNMKARPTNLHSRVAMQHLDSFFVGYVRQDVIEAGDEDDLYPNPRGILAPEVVATTTQSSQQAARKGSMFSGRDRQSIAKSASLNGKSLAYGEGSTGDLDESWHTAYRLRVSGQLGNLEKRQGLSSNFFLNCRLISKVLVVSPSLSRDLESKRNPVYRFKFAFDRPHHVLTVIPGDCFEFLIRKVSGNGSKTRITWISQKYTPLNVSLKGTFEVLIKVYQNGALTSQLDLLSPGDNLRVRAPLYHSILLNKRTQTGCYQQVALIGGGTGITPMLHLLDWYMRMKAKCEKEGVKSDDPQVPREVILIQCYSSDSDIIDAEHIKKLVDRSAGLAWSYTLVSRVDQSSYPSDQPVGKLGVEHLTQWIPFLPSKSKSASSGGVDVQPHDNLTGVIRNEATMDFNENTSPPFHFFVCGPKCFNTHVEKLLSSDLNVNKADLTLI